MASAIHQGQPVIHQGASLEQARAAVVLVHGRGGGAESILPLVSHLYMDGVAYFAPAAQDRTWYPERFLVPRERNQPYLNSALQAVADVVMMILDAGMGSERIMLVGFSQGACLSLEFAARHPRQYGGAAALSGGLIGADEELTGYVGSLKGTPILMGCSDRDSHIPVERIYTSAEILQGLGAAVDVRIYPGMGHTINQDEVDQMRDMLSVVVNSPA